MTQAIFLSYASQDADAARRICDALRAAGLEVWFDQSELRGGDAWDASIRKQIRECALFVPIISANTQAREEGYFRLEWKLAVDRSHLMADNKAFFVPVILGDIAEPNANVPDAFRMRQWSRLIDENTIAVFAARVAKLVGGSGVPDTNAAEVSPVDEFGIHHVSLHPNPNPLPRARSAGEAGRGMDQPGCFTQDATPTRMPAENDSGSLGGDVPARKGKSLRRTLMASGIGLALLVIALAAWAPWKEPKPGPATSASKAAPLDPQLKRAQDLIESIGAIASDIVLAEELIKGVLATRPTDPDAVLMMCRVHVYSLQRGFDRSETRFASAKEFAEKAFNLAPDHSAAKVCMADYLVRRGLDSERALKLVEEAIAAQPAVPRYHRLRNTVRATLPRFPRAEMRELASYTAEQFPQDALAQHDAALYYISDAQFPEAKKFLRRAIEAGPQASSAPTLASIEIWVSGDLDAAKAVLGQVTDKQRTAVRTLIVQVWYALLSGDTVSGQAALRAHPDPWMRDFLFTGPAALLNGELLLREGKAVLAKPYFEQAYAEWEKHKQELATIRRHAWIEPYLLFRLGRLAEARARNAVAFAGVPRPWRLSYNTDMWLFQPISHSLLLGERATALTLMKEAADGPVAKQVMRNALKLDPRMAPFRNDAEILKVLAE